jgi:hypothetical protein
LIILRVKKMLAILASLVAVGYGHADSDVSRDALSCSAIAYVSTLIPPDSLVEITKIPSDYIEQFYGSMSMMEQVFHAVYVANQSNNEDLPTNRELRSIRDAELIRLSVVYEQNAESLHDLYLRCDAWGNALSAFLESNSQELTGSDEEAIALFLKAPTFNPELTFNADQRGLGQLLSDSAFGAYLETRSETQ